MELNILGPEAQSGNLKRITNYVRPNQVVVLIQCDWFFGSWDMDNYVPTDDDATECTSIVSALTSSTREDLGRYSALLERI